MTEHFFKWLERGLEWPKMVGNSWKQKCCLLLRLQSTCTQQFYWTFVALCPPLCSLATSPYAERVLMLHDSTARVLSRTGSSCWSALKWALADWCCYGFCRLESQNQQWWRRRKAGGGKGSLNEWINQLMTRQFIEQPLASPGSAKNIQKKNFL